MPEPLILPFAALPFPQIDPVIFSVGPIAVHWYGLAYVAGILFAWWYARRLVATQRLWAHGQPAMSIADIDDFVVWAAIGVVAGGRIGYVLFYDLPRFLAEPADIIRIWTGGMSFHGGILGVILAMILFARARGISMWSLFDTVAAAVPVGLLLGRLANFVNAELWGRTTDVPWAFVFPTDPEFLPRHPSQLYEAALEGLVLFAVLAWLVWARGKLRRPKFIGGAFIAGYGLSRIVVEFFRMPDAQIGYLAGTGWLTMGMILSLPMVLVGIWAMATAANPEDGR
ncbi:MAG: prolipoprotein diacylglyceryl transferase [Notoacmeibacter sp.]|nr:prolipoprotein diacylglyceryl transferase [Notoacmeibacter sp.]